MYGNYNMGAGYAVYVPREPSREGEIGGRASAGFTPGWLVGLRTVPGRLSSSRWALCLPAIP